MTKKFLLVLISTTLVLLIAEYLITNNSNFLTRNVTMIGTAVLAIITLSTFIISYSTSLSSNPNKFVRGVMGSTFLKFILCAIAAGIYIYIVRKNLNKADLFFLMFLYVVYTTIETIFLSRISKTSLKK